MSASPVEILATSLFALALLHTFAAGNLLKLAHAHPRHEKLLHLLGEVEIVFGLWAIVLVTGLFALSGKLEALAYVDGRNYTEPLFVFAIMVVAASRPVLLAAGQLTQLLARLLPLPQAVAFYFATLALVPLLGSLITEPAAMTLAALLLRDRYYRHGLPARLQYATLGVLFVNVSIGGALTPFAAPPVLMVAATWGWDLPFMLQKFGAHVVPVVLLNAAGVTAMFYRSLLAVPQGAAETLRAPPWGLTLLHLAFVGGIVAFAHHPPVFLGILLLFMGVANAYPEHQDRLLLREALLVAFFLAGLVVLGGLQQWWLKPLLTSLSPREVYVGATALTAITDNAALTYLAAQVPGLSDEFKVYVVAGAISGGGLTVIANAPNPAGMAILKPYFRDGAVTALGLFAAALPPTLLVVTAFLAFPP